MHVGAAMLVWLALAGGGCLATAPEPTACPSAATTESAAHGHSRKESRAFSERDRQLHRLVLAPYLAQRRESPISDDAPDGPPEELRASTFGSNEPYAPTTSEEPCCSQQEIDAAWDSIQSAYVNVVNNTDRWQGCIDWSLAVEAAVAPVLPPCWQGRHVWRISVMMGTFKDDTFIHHAYAVAPCNARSLDDWKVLDPYTIVGNPMGLPIGHWFQQPNVIPLPQWIAGGNVWQATPAIVEDNYKMYLYTRRYYCETLQHPWRDLICRWVKDLLLKELRRVYGTGSEEAFQHFLRSIGW
jgi:hypothetical protein